ncbi:hypothetical protein MRQ86_23200 [Streptomyces sp. MMS21 TC-5]|uniref:hypothetical protein n=1 Tax=Streptomyces TaxID=1883 RepID=UPI0006AE09A7|nr:MULTISPECIES: hypothetical protein [unclassified Streptomyces]KOU17471.1 hypothetical protein ADK49_15820 [Streptomyces sp. WM6349]KOV01974.1 hypothetical protein ADK91_21590 [Streptomyces sp. XY511]KOV43720.1 hypothetical protein ADK98_20390 [Streptomyces sp. H036]MCI4083167.1 hypothetical protein [Streptomyces sp. MMS21 TC-5]
MGKNDDNGPGVSDEEWAQFMEQAAQGAGGAPKEPSARARMVTERLRATQGQEPPGWRTGPAWRERRRPGRLGAVAAVVAIAGLALIAVRPELVIDRLTGRAEAREDARKAGPLAAETDRPTAPPPSVDPDRPTLQDPFRGSPALQWADGAAGIELPEATAVGGVSKEKIAETLQNAKAFLVAANLDPAVLKGERPEAALALLDPKNTEASEHLEKSLAQPGRDQDPMNLFTRYNPAEVKPVGEVVKVRGRMWVEAGKEQGQADVRLDYSFVYPLVKAAPGADQVERTIVRREITFTVADPRKWQVTAGRLRLSDHRVDLANSACEVYDGYLHPGFDADPAAGPTPSGPPKDPYDRSKGIDEGAPEGCGTVSRT